MPATILSVQNAPGRSGYNNTNLVAVDGTNGNKWLNTGKELLVVANGSGGSLTVTLDFGAGAVVDGVTPSNKTVVVPTGDFVIIGPFPVSLYNDTSGYTTVTFSTGTSVTAAVFSGR